LTTLTSYSVRADESGSDRQGVIPEREYDEPEGFVLRAKDERDRQIIFKPQEDYQCFRANEWVKMGHLIADYHWLYGYARDMQLVERNYQAQIGKLELKVQLLGDTLDSVNKSRQYFSDLYDSERKLKLKSEFTNKVTMWLAVGVAVLEAGVIGALAASR